MLERDAGVPCTGLASSKAASHLGSRASRQYRASVLVVRKASTASSMAHVPRKPTQSRKNVVVLAVNVMGFMEVLFKRRGPFSPCFIYLAMQLLCQFSAYSGVG